MTKKEIILNILSELSECGETSDLEEYYDRIFAKILKGIKTQTFLHENWLERNKSYINIEDFKKVFEID